MKKSQYLWNFVLALMVGLMGLFATACPPTEETKDAGPQHECEVPKDCGGGYDCAMDETLQIRKCVKLYCTVDNDCTPQGEDCKCDVRRGLCVCGDNCRPDLAGSCPSGTVCLSGNCVQPPPPADSCEITPANSVVRVGQTTTLSVAGYMSSGALAPLAAFTWASSNTSCATVDASGVVTGATGATATCTATITATAAGSTGSCSAAVSTFPAVALPALRALVVEELTGDPIVGAKLVVRTGTGTIVAGNPVTDVNGIANVADVGTSNVADLLDVSVFDANHVYVTVVKPGTSDLLFVLKRVQDTTKMAGVKGTFDLTSVHSQGDIKLGIAGMSVPGSLTDIDFESILGPTVLRDINLSGVGNYQDVPLPSGLYMMVGATDIKDYFASFGEPGRRILWGIGGRVSLSDVGPIIREVTAAEGDLDLGGMLSAIIPYFGTFDHALIGNLNLVEVSRPTTGEPKDWTFDPATSQTLRTDKLLGQSAAFTIPTLPNEPGLSTPISGAVMFLGSLAPGAGWVPLGLSAGLDAPNDNSTVDGRIEPADCPDTRPDCIKPDPGQVIVDFAAPHSGIEGSPYIALCMALGMESIGTALHTSLLFSITDSVSALPTANTFPVTTFLGFPTGGSYIKGVSYAQTGNVTGASFYRLNLDVNGRKWQVYSDSASTINLPTPPAGMEARDANADIQAFKTFASAGSFGVRNLFEFSGNNLGNLVNLTGAFSTLECVDLEQPKLASPADNTGCLVDGEDSGYTYDSATGLCVGGPNDITAFGSFTSCPTGYEPVYLTGTSGKGICARTPVCRWHQS